MVEDSAFAKIRILCQRKKDRGITGQTRRLAKKKHRTSLIGA